MRCIEMLFIVCVLCSQTRLTLTWDVLKSHAEPLRSKQQWLTLTWDVLKYFNRLIKEREERD